MEGLYTADDFNTDRHVGPDEAIERLRTGNRVFVDMLDHKRDLSAARIKELFENGQHPFATIITCADSRVVPEHIFMAGLGELFVIRVAGNVVGDIEAASAIYSCEHLNCRLLFVLGHTHCGAIKAAIDGEGGAVAPITSKIATVIEGEKDPYRASVLNVEAAIDALRETRELADLEESGNLRICGGIYHTHCGVVDFLV